MIRKLAALAVLTAALIGSPVRAQPLAELGDHLLHGDPLLDDPGGGRRRLEALGVTAQLFYQQFLAWKPRGGGVDSSSAGGYSGSYDLLALADLESLMGWTGGGFLLHVKGQYDRNINDEVGALSNPIDDADFDEPIYVDELWLQQRFWNDRLRVRLGFMEQQTLYDRNAYANSEDSHFMSTFLDNNALVPLPNGLGVALIAAPAPGLEIAAGCADADNQARDAGFDTAFDGIDSLTAYLEVTLRPDAWGILSGRPGAYRFGMFVDGRNVEEFDGESDADASRSRGHLGAYLNFDQLAWRENERDLQGLGMFGRFGYADPDANPVAWFWSLGLQYQGPIPGRDADRVGLGVYQAIASKEYRDKVDPGFDMETGIELYYLIQVLGWLAITPDLQYIVDPGASGIADDAVVAVLRLRLSF